jgi:hypothetical protein
MGSEFSLGIVTPSYEADPAMNRSRKNDRKLLAGWPDDRSGDPSDDPATHGEPDEASDLDLFDPEEVDEAGWEAFLADDDEIDPLPEYGDFWLEDD